MPYENLTDEQRHAMCEDQITQLEQRRFSFELDAVRHAAVGESTAQIERQIADLDKAIKATRTERDKLAKSTGKPSP